MFKKIDENMVVLQAEKKESETDSGFQIQSAMNETKKEIGTVVQIGEAVKRIEVGDRVIFKAYNADTVEKDGDNYEFIHQDHVLASL